MEPATALIHRYVMHLVGWAWHKSHHERIGKPFELNDLFPIVFSFVAIALFLLGRSNSVFTAIGIGVTLYGLVYFVVHELIIHSRFFKISNNNWLFSYWRFSHNVHHQYNKAPYGFIAPITPRELSVKAKENERDLINRYSSSKIDR